MITLMLIMKLDAEWYDDEVEVVICLLDEMMVQQICPDNLD